MRKDKYGIAYAAYAVLAFVLAIFGQTVGLLLLLGFLIAVEKDEWTTRQAIQATGLLFLDYIIGRVRSIIFMWCDWVSPEYDTFFYNFKNFCGKLNNIAIDAIGILILVLAVLAIVNVSKQKDANVPIVGGIANWAYGIVAPKPAPAPAPQMNGAGPQMNGAGPQMNGAGPQMNGAGPQMNGAAPQMNGAAPQMTPVVPGMPMSSMDSEAVKDEDKKDTVSLKKADEDTKEEVGNDAEKPKFCMKCGAKIEGGKFCVKCGAPIE